MKSNFSTIVDIFSQKTVAVFGDVIFDRYLIGDVGRISPEAPVVVVNVIEEKDALGGAANVASNLASVGVKTELGGIIGQESAGDDLLKQLAIAGIGSTGLLRGSRPTATKTRILARGQQVVRVDKEVVDLVNSDIEQALISWLDKQIDSADALVVSDYGKGVVTPGILEHLAKRFQGTGLGDRQIPLLIDPKDRNFEAYASATIVTPNRKEASAAADRSIDSVEDAVAVAGLLCEKWGARYLLVTLSEQGMVLVSSQPEEPVVSIPTEAKEVFDVTGAGDTVIALCAAALAAGAKPEAAARIANAAAGIVVAQVGAVAVGKEDLLKALS
ncbi:UNVERIFIED_CONTAM: hypothetical protein GTU68_023926 [Idotea baltica]|nr:hypothetical protein [Idotea baltica]